MIIRQALFEGKILPSRGPDFRAYVETNLLPMWRSFPHAREVRVMYEVDRDAGLPGIVLVLSIAFDNAEALQEALDSSVRHESREMTKGLLEMFEGRVRHHIYEVAHTVSA